MKRLLTSLFCVAVLQFGMANKPAEQEAQNPKIQIALLLDVSNSMDGLIDQAKAQLWKIVNELALMKKDGQQASMEIALYTFGDDRLKADDGYIQQWNTFSGDLDIISQNLFALTTSGGDEYCGWVISDVVNELRWSSNQADLQIIVIAGNESFAQGARNYISSCEEALQKNIIINTIYCGKCSEGRSLFWEDGAMRGQGKYMCIDQNESVEFIPTPYDSLINIQNQKLNDTYHGYGSSGAKRKAMQVAQDDEARDYSSAYMTERTLSKSSHVYSNASWDILDYYQDNPELVLEFSDAELPDLLKGKTRDEKLKILDDLKIERDNIKQEVGVLSKKRAEFIESYRRTNLAKDNSLDTIMLMLIREQAIGKGFKNM